MRNIVTVIDRVLEIIPKNPLNSRLRGALKAVAYNAGYCPPEHMGGLWSDGSKLLFTAFEGLDPIDLTGWERTVVDIWTDRIFWKDMTRDEACRAYADCAGQKDGETIFTDQDILWADEYNYAQVMSDKELLRWLEENYG
jgi:hypothetical protein